MNAHAITLPGGRVVATMAGAWDAFERACLDVELTISHRLHRIRFKRLDDKEEIRLWLTVKHANSAAEDRRHRDEIRLNVARNWRFTEADLLKMGAKP